MPKQPIIHRILDTFSKKPTKTRVFLSISPGDRKWLKVVIFMVFTKMAKSGDFHDFLSYYILYFSQGPPAQYGDLCNDHFLHFFTGFGTTFWPG